MLPRPPISTLFPYTTLFRSGSGGETSFTTRTLSLASFENRAIQVRFSFNFSTGSYFTGSSAGWYIDDISDRKSTRLNSSHGYISYAVFCLKKKTKRILQQSL